MRAFGVFRDGKQGDVPTIEFTVVWTLCTRLNEGPSRKYKEACSFLMATENGHPRYRLATPRIVNSIQLAVRLPV